MTPEEFFESHPEARPLFAAVRKGIRDLDDVTERASKSQVAFSRKRAFAWVWVPDQYLKRKGLAPLVLSIGLRRRDPSARWKEVVEPKPGRFMHHLEVWTPKDIDGEVRGWLREAWAEAI